MEENYDAIVVGSGHAGVEAALALARTGQKTLIITLNLDSVAYLACNPSIGGTAKGHLVCEIDALGGEMGRVADKCTLSMRMLNAGKGAAVQSLRAQVDKVKYHSEMKKVLEGAENLWIKQGEVSSVLTQKDEVCGVEIDQGLQFFAKKVIIATGVYLQSRIIMGDYVRAQGPSGFASATLLTKSLMKLGFEIRRFKTGTPARVDLKTIDTSVLEKQDGDEGVRRFSFLDNKPAVNKMPCFLGYTNERTHEIIKNNITRAPMYSGKIDGVGARYCPSIEDKVIRFADKNRHQFFLEPESSETCETYVQGISTSMPADIQQQIINSCVGLEKAWIMRYAYAIEYDCINSTELLPTLESKRIKGLYFAGQINGTSGYEEAAAQGLMAGINASLALRGKKPLVLGRDEGYIGVLIDDLVTKGTNEPYRMMTSRAEYRLSLRQDNADERLTFIGVNVGLADEKRLKKLKRKLKTMKSIINELKKVVAPSKKLNNMLARYGESEIVSGAALYNLIKRPNIDIFKINEEFNLFNEPKEILEQINTRIKYEGYIGLENKQIESARRMEEIILPEIDYAKIKGLRIEAQQKLNKIKPLNIGQASRISGVSPADISVLIIYLKSANKT